MIRRTADEEPVWQSILNLLYYEHKPFGETGGSLVEDMAYATWQVRAVREAIGKYDIDTDNPEERKRLELLHRYLRSKRPAPNSANNKPSGKRKRNSRRTSSRA
jgi:hypothetical protein